jgi:hypothetical protein
MTYMNYKLLLWFSVFYHPTDVLTVFHNYVITYDKFRDCNTRRKDHIYGCSVKTSCGHYMVKHAGSAAWSKLPSYLKEACSVRTCGVKFKIL